MNQEAISTPARRQFVKLCDVISPKISGRKKRGQAYSGHFCCAPGCTNQSGKDTRAGICRHYYLFPKDVSRRRAWIRAIPREKWDPSSSSKICSDHFVGGKKTDNPGSVGFIPTRFEGADKTKGKKTPKPRQTRTAKRSLNFDAQIQPKSKRRRVQTPEPGGRPKVAKVTTPGLPDHDYIHTTMLHGCATQLTHLKQENVQLQEKITLLERKTLSPDTLDTSKFRKWTNLPNKDVFDAIATYLKKRGADELKYWRGKETSQHKHFRDAGFVNKPGPERKLTFDDEFFLVLVKLKTGLDNIGIAHLFGISPTAVGQIFTTHLNFLNNELKLLFAMADGGSEEAVAECFRNFPDLQVVLDCTEIFTEKPEDLQIRKRMYSNYKGHETIKYMVGLSPKLYVNYISAAYGGRASDKHITLESHDLLEALPPGSSVMVDRGFNVGEELKKLGVELIIPDFKGRGRSQMSRSELEHSEHVAHARIHIERIIQRIRTFKLLAKTAALSSSDIHDQMFTTCAYLTNFQSPIIKV